MCGYATYCLLILHVISFVFNLTEVGYILSMYLFICVAKMLHLFIIVSYTSVILHY